LLASEPGGIFRRQKNSDRGDVPGLTDAAERGLGDGELLEIRSDEAAAVGAFGLDYARTDGVDPDLLRAELAGQHAGDGVDRALSAGVNRAAWRCDAADKGANVDDATPLSEVLHSGLRRKEEAQHVDVEVPVKVLVVDGLGGASSYTPELFTRMSSRPKFLMAASIMPCASAALETSPCTATAFPPAAVMAATTASAPALLEA